MWNKWLQEYQLYKLINTKETFHDMTQKENETFADIGSGLNCLMLYFGKKMFRREYSKRKIFHQTLQYSLLQKMSRDFSLGQLNDVHFLNKDLRIRPNRL
jgi:hypothetical protein